MNVLGGVVFFRDAFGGVKAVSTFLCILGFCSYVYGIYKDNQMGEHKLASTRNKTISSNASSTEMIHIVNYWTIYVI